MGTRGQAFYGGSCFPSSSLLLLPPRWVLLLPRVPKAFALPLPPSARSKYVGTGTTEAKGLPSGCQVIWKRGKGYMHVVPSGGSNWLPSHSPSPPPSSAWTRIAGKSPVIHDKLFQSGNPLARCPVWILCSLALSLSPRRSRRTAFPHCCLGCIHCCQTGMPDR